MFQKKTTLTSKREKRKEIGKEEDNSIKFINTCKELNGSKRQLNKKLGELSWPQFPFYSYFFFRIEPYASIHIVRKKNT